MQELVYLKTFVRINFVMQRIILKQWSVSVQFMSGDLLSASQVLLVKSDYCAGLY